VIKMYRTEVEEWLYTIGLPHLYDYFVEDGFNTLEKVRRMRQSDIDAIVDRNGYMIILNEEIDRLNYEDGYNHYPSDHNESHRAGSYFNDSSNDFESRDVLLKRYETSSVPAVGFASRHFARRAKSKSRKVRGTSAAPIRNSAERYVPNSASEQYEAIFLTKRAASVAAATAKEAETAAALSALEERQRKRNEEREKRAKTGK
jgi:hypothetical protein